MHKLMRTFLIMMILGITCNAQARVIQKSELINIVEKIVYDQTAEYMAQYNVDKIDVKVVNMPVESITTTGDSPVKIRVISNFDRFLTYDIKKVMVIDADTEKVIKTIPTNVRTLVYKDVLVSTARIGLLSPINLSNTKVENLEVGSVIEQVMDKIDSNSPIIALRPIMLGKMVLKTSVRKKPDVAKLEAVKISFVQNDMINIEVDGIAEAEGNIGDTILVKNTRFNKIHTALITGKNRVEVKLWKNIYWF